MSQNYITILTASYDAYVATFCVNGVLPLMMDLKREHTHRVLDNARRIMRGENFDEHDTILGEAAALLHDTGRYEQLKRFNTFRDSDSVDHAQFSHDIVIEKGWLATYPANDRECILTAVALHNRRELPATLAPHIQRITHLVRDADKLDIFYILKERFENHDWRNHPEIFWNLPVNDPPNPTVVAAVCSGQPVHYEDIRTLSDFVLIQVGWLIAGLHYTTTRRLAKERHVLEFREAFLSRLNDSPDIARCCAAARAALEANT